MTTSQVSLSSVFQIAMLIVTGHEGHSKWILDIRFSEFPVVVVCLHWCQFGAKLFWLHSLNVFLSPECLCSYLVYLNGGKNKENLKSRIFMHPQLFQRLFHRTAALL